MSASAVDVGRVRFRGPARRDATRTVPPPPVKFLDSFVAMVARCAQTASPHPMPVAILVVPTGLAS
jgi:hypothetical protein